MLPSTTLTVHLIALAEPIIPVFLPETDEEDTKAELVARVIQRPIHITTREPTTVRPTTAWPDNEITTHDEVAEASTQSPLHVLDKVQARVPDTEIRIDRELTTVNNGNTCSLTKWPNACHRLLCISAESTLLPLNIRIFMYRCDRSSAGVCRGWTRPRGSRLCRYI